MLAIKAVCASGTGRTAELNDEVVIARNKFEGIKFFIYAADVSL